MITSGFQPYHPKNFDTPDGLPVDNIIFTVTSEPHPDPSKDTPIKTLKVLLIQRRIDPTKNPEEVPYQGYWAFPGGFSNRNESLDQAAYRELKEETNIGENVFLEQFKTVYAPGRDPRGWIPSVLYIALVHEVALLSKKAGDDAGKAELISVQEALTMNLAFDHKQLLQEAWEHLRAKVHRTTLIKELLPESFTITELYETLKAVDPEFEVDKGNFMKKMTNSKKRQGLIEPVIGMNGEQAKSQAYSKTPAKLYRFCDFPLKVSLFNLNLF
ncbi:MAG TPA: NUDIX domain-containing protein [Bacillota bacterium]|nr:NUDIX domain-containing protein [Bacillota bacterium]